MACEEIISEAASASDSSEKVIGVKATPCKRTYWEMAQGRSHVTPEFDRQQTRHNTSLKSMDKSEAPI